jgi:hypothetical protein
MTTVVEQQITRLATPTDTLFDAGESGYKRRFKGIGKYNGMGIALACETFTKAVTRAKFKLAMVERQNKAFVYLGHALEQRFCPRGDQHGNVAIGARVLKQNEQALRH